MRARRSSCEAIAADFALGQPSRSNVLAISGAVFANTGNYALVVTNNYGSVTSSIASLTVIIPPGISNAVANPNGTFSLNLLGTPGSSYVLEATTNLSARAEWHPVATNTLNTNGTWLFLDYMATNYPQQFYRLEVVP